MYLAYAQKINQILLSKIGSCLSRHMTVPDRLISNRVSEVNTLTPVHPVLITGLSSVCSSNRLEIQYVHEYDVVIKKHLEVY